MGTYEELFQKAMVLYNTVFSTSLNPMAIDVDIEEIKFIDEAANAPVPNRNRPSPEPNGADGDS
jgi:hypothetical protein